jgi:hypothetical protein
MQPLIQFIAYAPLCLVTIMPNNWSKKALAFFIVPKLQRWNAYEDAGAWELQKVRN